MCWWSPSTPPRDPRQRTVCSLGDLSPRPREEWLKLARKIEDALIGQRRPARCRTIGEVADIVRRVRARRADGDRANDDAGARSAADGRGALIKVDPTRVTTERHREAGPVHVGHQFWQRLGLDHILRDCGLSASRATAGLCDGAQSLDRAVLRTRHAGLDPAHRTRRHSRRRLRGG